MAEEIKLSALGTAVSLPDAALFYVVVENVSYKITKAELFAGISGTSLIPFSTYTIYQDTANTAQTALTANDIVFGRWSGDAFDDGDGVTVTPGQMILAKYNGGGVADFNNYTFMSSF